MHLHISFSCFLKTNWRLSETIFDKIKTISAHQRTSCRTSSTSCSSYLRSPCNYSYRRLSCIIHMSLQQKKKKQNRIPSLSKRVARLGCHYYCLLLAALLRLNGLRPRKVLLSTSLWKWVKCNPQILPSLLLDRSNVERMITISCLSTVWGLCPVWHFNHVQHCPGWFLWGICFRVVNFFRETLSSDCLFHFPSGTWLCRLYQGRILNKAPKRISNKKDKGCVFKCCLIWY